MLGSSATPDRSGWPEVASMQIDPRLRVDVLRKVMDRFGRVHIPGFLTHASACAAYAAVTAPLPWQLHFNDGNDVFDVQAAEFESLPHDKREAVLRPIYLRARHGFQYIYDNLALSDFCARGEFLDYPVMRLFDFLASDAFMEFARGVTGICDIASIDAQLTRYRPGHFLTLHDDRDDAKGRVAAYVLNLTATWRTDWGGILVFPDKDGHVTEGYVPTFNALNIFKVPTPHLVSVVAPCAGGPRLSITGWLRR